MAPNRVRARLTPTSRRARSTGGVKLDDTTIKQICDLVRDGAGFDVALNYLGIQTDRFWKWMRRGENYLRGNNQPPEHEVHGKFVLALRKAHAEFIMELTKGVRKDKGWFRDLSLLERKDRKNWSRRDPQGGSLENYDPNEKFL
jgi:hypothetical protein